VALLAAGGISPSDSTLATSDVQAALANAFGQASLQCTGGQLAGVGLCLDKSLAPMDCPSNVEQTCGDSFVFPAAAPYY
jgi:ribonuclease I